MGERNASQVMYYLRDRSPDVFYDEESENEADGEKVHEEVSDEQYCDEDPDVHQPKKTTSLRKGGKQRT